MNPPASERDIVAFVVCLGQTSPFVIAERTPDAEDVPLQNLGLECVSGQTAPRSSSCVTSRPPWSTRYRRMANGFGFRGTLVFSAIRMAPQTLIDRVPAE